MRGISSDRATRRSRVGTVFVAVEVVNVVAAVAGDDRCGDSCGEEDAMMRRF